MCLGWGRCRRPQSWDIFPNLGKLEQKEIAALVGVAPFNRDSGKLRGSAEGVVHGHGGSGAGESGDPRVLPAIAGGGRGKEGGAGGMHEEAFSHSERDGEARCPLVPVPRLALTPNTVAHPQPIRMHLCTANQLECLPRR